MAVSTHSVLPSGLRLIVTAFGRDEGRSPREIMTKFVNVTLQVPVDASGKLLLPENLSFGGDLNLRGTAIKALPDNLSVGGGLFLRGMAIAALPDNLSVGGDLFLRGTAITEIPASAKIAGKIYGLGKSA
jgi:hypothetical protein